MTWGQARGRWGPRRGPAGTCHAGSKMSLPLASLAEHLQPGAVPPPGTSTPQALLPSPGPPAHHGELEPQHKRFAKLKRWGELKPFGRECGMLTWGFFSHQNFLFACIVGQNIEFLSKWLCLEVAEFVWYSRWLFHWFLTQMKRIKERQS